MDNTESISDKPRRRADESEKKQRYVYPTLCAYDDMDIEITESDHISERALFRRIADDIDAEKQSILRNCAYPLTQEVGKPLKGDEDFKSWLDRYYLPRPLFEDGEPVQFGEMAAHPILDKPSPIKSIEYFGDGSFALWFDGTEAITGYNNGERVKRPKPQVLDANGVPIETGDKVWLLPGEHCDSFPLHGYYACREYEVVENNNRIHRSDGRICISGGDYIFGYPKPEQVTHREPDTQERIDKDATMPPRAYYAKHIGNIAVGLKDDEEVWTAVTAHLLRRQRELDGRDA